MVKTSALKKRARGMSEGRLQGEGLSLGMGWKNWLNELYLAEKQAE